MSLFSVSKIQLVGVAACVPQNVVSNYDYELISPKERELLVKTVGIEKRRIAQKGICASDLCFEAAQQLLNDLGWERREVEVLVFITQTPDYITPATSNILQQRLGLSKNCIALDINLGCSGYVYGLAVVSSLLQTLGKGKALLLAGDISSATLSEKDKSSAPIFSDAGSATALQWRQNAAPVYFNLQGDGSGYDAIIIPAGGYRHPVDARALEEQTISEGITRNQTHLILKGIDVFNFSVNEVPANVEALLNFAGKDRAAVNYFLFHQANLIINESIRKKLKLTPEQVPYSLRDFGNTSSATIPVTLITQLRNRLISEKLEMVFSGFGVGLSWSSAYLETEKLVCCELIEV